MNSKQKKVLFGAVVTLALVTLFPPMVGQGGYGIDSFTAGPEMRWLLAGDQHSPLAGVVGLSTAWSISWSHLLMLWLVVGGIAAAGLLSLRR